MGINPYTFLQLCTCLTFCHLYGTYYKSSQMWTPHVWSRPNQIVSWQSPYPANYYTEFRQFWLGILKSQQVTCVSWCLHPRLSGMVLLNAASAGTTAPEVAPWLQHHIPCVLVVSNGELEFHASICINIYVFYMPGIPFSNRTQLWGWLHHLLCRAHRGPRRAPPSGSKYKKKKHLQITKYIWLESSC